MTRGPVEAVLFDLDDTLYRELDFVAGGFRAAAALVTGRSGRSIDDLVTRMFEIHGEDGRGRIFDRLLEELGCWDDALVRAMLLTYRAHPSRIRPFDDVPPVLERLRARGVRLGIVTDGLASVQRRKLDALGLAPQFDAIVPTDELGPGAVKPAPTGFRVALLLLGIPTERAGHVAYVANDTRKDFAGARAAGLVTIRVRDLPDEGGPGIPAPTGPIEDADCVAEPFETLLDVLESRA